MYKNKKEILIVVSLFCILSVMAFVYKYIGNKSNNQSESISVYTENKEDDSKKTSDKDNLEDKIYVHIDGEVNKPNLYEMKSTDRLKDLIDKAGGLTKDADSSKINLAIKLKDEMKIHIYKINEENKNDTIKLDDQNTSNLENKFININTADEDELCKLEGIGPSKAKMIIEYRKKNKFNKIDDITKVSGIGKKTFEKIKDKITVD